MIENAVGYGDVVGICYHQQFGPWWEIAFAILGALCFFCSASLFILFFVSGYLRIGRRDTPGFEERLTHGPDGLK